VCSWKLRILQLAPFVIPGKILCEAAHSTGTSVFQTEVDVDPSQADNGAMSSLTFPNFNRDRKGTPFENFVASTVVPKECLRKQLDSNDPSATKGKGNHCLIEHC
jgi:hypothetical protein